MAINTNDQIIWEQLGNNYNPRSSKGVTIDSSVSRLTHDIKWTHYDNGGCQCEVNGNSYPGKIAKGNIWTDFIFTSWDDVCYCEFPCDFYAPVTFHDAPNFGGSGWTYFLQGARCYDLSAGNTDMHYITMSPWNHKIQSARLEPLDLKHPEADLGGWDCYIYDGPECSGAAGGPFSFTNSEPNLAKWGWADRTQSLKCVQPADCYGATSCP
ncbi:hypothetical protein N431DRAFT_463960 [Stipitochalara longipes BDJ]|nr:hypothetical protein N431DRAFT_463960 [Stipitochalara longipes BDJ]